MYGNSYRVHENVDGVEPFEGDGEIDDSVNPSDDIFGYEDDPDLGEYSEPEEPDPEAEDEAYDDGSEPLDDDVAADSATLASAGWGMDEDYGSF